MTISFGDLVALTAELVAIDSTNPDLVAGGAGEAEITRFVAAWLASAGLDIERHELGPGRANVIDELASIGMQDVLRRMGADAAIVNESTRLDLCVAHKGFVRTADALLGIIGEFYA